MLGLIFFFDVTIVTEVGIAVLLKCVMFWKVFKAFTLYLFVNAVNSPTVGRQTSIYSGDPR